MNSKITRFEDLVVWQESIGLATKIYQLLKDCRDFGMKDQMQRAAVSVPSNIAEGYERRYNKEFIRFLKIAKGSLGELRTQLLIAVNIRLIQEETGKECIEKTRYISAMIFKLIEMRNKSF